MLQLALPDLAHLAAGARRLRQACRNPEPPGRRRPTRRLRGCGGATFCSGRLRRRPTAAGDWSWRPCSGLSSSRRALTGKVRCGAGRPVGEERLRLLSERRRLEELQERQLQRGAPSACKIEDVDHFSDFSSVILDSRSPSLSLQRKFAWIPTVLRPFYLDLSPSQVCAAVVT